MALAWPPKKKKLVVDACPGGGGGGSCEPPKMGGFKFPSRKKTKSKPDPVPAQSGTHQNVRDLGSDPGEVRMQKSSSGSGLTTEQQAQGAVNERATSAARLKFRKRR